MNYQIKKAVIVARRSVPVDTEPATGNFHRVKVLPEMDSIPDSDFNNLPLYPNFLSEKESAYDVGATVWVICTHDYEVGFIIGADSPPAGQGITSFVQLINRAEILSGVEEKNISGYNQLNILRHSGRAIHFENIDTGVAGVVYNNGSCYVFGSDGSFFFQPGGSLGLRVYVNNAGDATIASRNMDTSSLNETHQIYGSYSEDVGGTKDVSVGSLTTKASGNMRHVALSMDSLSLGERSDVTTTTKKETIGDKVVTTVGIVPPSLIDPLPQSFTLRVGVGGITISSLTAINLNAPAINLPKTAGLLGAFNSLPLCLFTGAPHVTQSVISTGI